MTEAYLVVLYIRLFRQWTWLLLHMTVTYLVVLYIRQFRQWTWLLLHVTVTYLVVLYIRQFRQWTWLLLHVTETYLVVLYIRLFRQWTWLLFPGDRTNGSLKTGQAKWGLKTTIQHLIKLCMAKHQTNVCYIVSIYWQLLNTNIHSYKSGQLHYLNRRTNYQTVSVCSLLTR